MEEKQNKKQLALFENESFIEFSEEEQKKQFNSQNIQQYQQQLQEYQKKQQEQFEKNQNQQQQQKQQQQLQDSEQLNSNNQIEQVMQTPYETEPEKFQDYQAFVKQYKHLFEQDIIRFPLPAQELKLQFKQFCQDHQMVISNFLNKKFDQQYTEEEVILILESEILDPILLKMSDDLQNDIRQNIGTLVSKLNCEQIFSLELILQKLEEKKNIIETEFINYLTINTKQYFQQPQYQGGKPDIYQKSQVVSNLINNLYIFFLKYNEKIYQRFQLYDKFDQQLQEFIEWVQTLLLKNLKQRHPLIIKQLTTIINQCLQKRINQVNNEIYDNLFGISGKNIQIYLQFGKEYKTINQQMFIEDLKNDLGFVPCEILVNEYKQQLDILIDSYIKKEVDKINIGFVQLYNNKYQNLICCLDDKFTNKQIFTLLNQQQIQDVFILLCCQIANIVRNKEEFLIFKQIIIILQQILSKNEQKDEKIQYLNSLVINGQYENVLNEKNTLLQMKKQSLEQFIDNNFKNEKQMLQFLVDLYFLFNNIEIKEDILNIKQISTVQRYFLNKIILEFQSGKFEYLNIEIIRCLDQICEENIIFDFSGQYPSNLLKKHKLKLNYSQNQYELLCFLRNAAKERNSKEINIKEKHEQLFQEKINELFINNLQGKGDLPEKFYIEKVSDPKKCSRKITICISGFTSEDEDKFKKWKDYIAENQDTEVYILHYACKSMEDNYKFASQKMANYTTVAGLLSVFGNPYIKAMQIGYTIATSVKNNPFKEAFQEANQSGKFLAHFLASHELFPNCSISLLGFSLGTQVILSCMEELQKYKIADCIQDVLLMGGVADSQAIQNLGKMEFLGGRLINCHSSRDNVIKYIYKLLSYKQKPVGTYKINTDSQNKHKIFNFDTSNFIKGHMEYTKHLPKILQMTDLNKLDYYKLFQN